MTDTITQNPARTLQDIGIPLLGRAGAAECRYCGAVPGALCADLAGSDHWAGGTHLARFVRAYVRGLITPEEISAVVNAAGDVFTNGTVIADGAL